MRSQKCLITDCRGFLRIECLSFLKKSMSLFITENFPFKWMPKFNLVSNIRPRCLWDSEQLTYLPLKMREGWMTLDFFLENKTSCAIFVGSGLK